MPILDQYTCALAAIAATALLTAPLVAYLFWLAR